MKILLYGINFSPELTGIGKYTGEMAAWLASKGHEVRVVTAPPYYPDWAVGQGYSGWRYKTEAWQGVRVLRCPVWVPCKPTGLKRLVHLVSFALSSLPALLAHVRWRPQLVWVVEPALFCAPSAVLLAHLCGAKSWLHVQDFELDAAFSMGLLRGERLRRLASRAEAWLMRRFDVVSTISRRMHELLLRKGVDPMQANLAVNWVNMASFALPSPDGVAAYREELQLAPGQVVALYSGNMGGKQGLEILADVARLLVHQTHLVFVFCGNGAGRADLLERCKGLPNVRFLDLQPVSRLPDLLATADIHLLPQRADAADLVMPSKLTGMLASARPVVATAHTGTDLATVVETCGLVVAPENPEAMAQAINTLVNDQTMRETLGAAGYEYAHAHLDSEAVLGKFESDLQALVAQGERA
ncbi:MAG: glycosyltransferase WbuB [Hydrogenophaga sp.]|uniref:glycosyltransferase WbuB n=1 Tax=Hydrogenophaga sp. TaxID=1904254 RepID=UPI002732B184|nr:glycosyltransferase WbuB [Hydrogenophaga sp.]MDP3346691.1 glycosyltransferase WbuB [Hydrogenophaga sp.]MDP3809082.1 glycosyltransferase WbuB [Hydrogenophaga sp.]MDP3927075.1 glycosyltransferase WbuB [Hydrogenophaga sp.]